MKKLFFSFFLVTSYLFLVTFPIPTFAIISNPVLSDKISSTDPKGYFNNVLSAVIGLFFLIGIIYFMWHIVFAGYHLIGADGDPKKMETAKNEITYSVLGLFVIFSIYAIMKFIGVVLGIPGLDALSIVWPTL